MPVSGGRFRHSHSLYSGSPVATVLLKCRLAIGFRHAHSHAATTARDRHCLGLTQSQAFGCPGSLAAAGNGAFWYGSSCLSRHHRRRRIARGFPANGSLRCDWQPVPAQNYPAASRLAQALARRYRESPALGAIPARTASGAIAAAVLRGRA